jgi:FKBP-type peptidyl-prolyl cis-trans isomerase 2
MRRHAILLTTTALLVLGCGGDDSSNETTTAANQPTATSTTAVPGDQAPSGNTPQDGDSVAVHYVGTLDDGSQFDSSRDRGEPLTFEIGTDPPQVIKGFEDTVRGMTVGDVVTVRIPPEDAYGEVEPDLIFTVPIERAPDDVAVGDEVLIGGITPGVVTAVTANEVEIDTNHRFAGQALTFEIELLSIDRP